MTTSIPEPEFVLKATPPRMPRISLRRDRLSRRWGELRCSTAIAVVAPDGFGKSTLLLQWRRLWLEQGALVAWLTADALDDAVRFHLALLHALRHASGRSRFDTLAARHASQPDQQVEGLTGLLAEIARLGVETVLIFDECQRLPQATVRESLAYLIHNAPANLHLVVGSTLPLRLTASGRADTGSVAVLGADELCLQEEDSSAILLRRFGERLGPDDYAVLHRIADGWPMGLQLAASAIEHAPDMATAVADLAHRIDEPMGTRLIESLLARLDPDLIEFLTRIAIFDHMNIELCVEVTGSSSARDHLAHLMFETPLLIIGQTKDWSCLHPLAREVLLLRFAALPARERRDLHRRAGDWFEERQRFPEAVRHAEAAGDIAHARSMLSRWLWQLGSEGRLPEAREAIARIPPESIAQDIDLRLIVVWILACSERNAEALEDAQKLLADPELDSKAAFLAALVAASAAGYADHLGLISGILARWPEGSAAIDNSGQPAAYANCVSVIALHQGRTAHLRELEPRTPAATYKYSPVLGRAIGRTLVGLSHLWDGHPDRAEAVMRPAMLQAEQATGRRGVVACMFASVAAAALFERNQPKAARALLAGRLDVIESTAIPDVILCAYRTLAYVALNRGDEMQALSILGDLRTIAQVRRLPRLALHGLVEQIRIHALQSRSESVCKLMEELDEMAAIFSGKELAPFRSQYDLLSAIARTYAAIARDDLGSAERNLMSANALAAELNRGRDLLIIKILRAVVAQRRGAPLAGRLLKEAISQGKFGGNQRLLADSHPLAVAMAAELRAAANVVEKTRKIKDVGGADPAAVSKSFGKECNGLLTPKEAVILSLLKEQLSNESIAGAMELSDESVKWHLRNLYMKLSAGTRSHAVDRARLLGLIES